MANEKSLVPGATAPPQSATAPVAAPSLIRLMATECHMDPQKFAQTIISICFPGGKATNEQLAALLLVAREHHLNPLTKEIYAFPAKGGGITPIVGVDGWIKLANEHPSYDGMEFDHIVEHGDLLAITCTIHRKDRSHVTAATEWMAECKRNTEPWNNMPRRMLRNRAVCQAIRLAFGFAGVMESDEAEAMIERGDPMTEIRANANATVIDVTHEAAALTEGTAEAPEPGAAVGTACSHSSSTPNPDGTATCTFCRAVFTPGQAPMATGGSAPAQGLDLFGAGKQQEKQAAKKKL